MVAPKTSYAGNQSNPAENAVAITPDDNTDLTMRLRGIYVGGGGNITVQLNAGTNVLFTAVPQGTVLPICASRVMATGTTATNLVGLY